MSNTVYEYTVHILDGVTLTTPHAGVAVSQARLIAAGSGDPALWMCGTHQAVEGTGWSTFREENSFDIASSIENKSEGKMLCMKYLENSTA